MDSFSVRDVRICIFTTTTMLHSTSPATTPAPPTTTPTAPSTTGSSRWLIGWCLVPDLEHFCFWADKWWLLVRRQYRLRGGLWGGLQQVTTCFVKRWRYLLSCQFARLQPGRRLLLRQDNLEQTRIRSLVTPVLWDDVAKIAHVGVCRYGWINNCKGTDVESWVSDCFWIQSCELRSFEIWIVKLIKCVNVNHAP